MKEEVTQELAVNSSSGTVPEDDDFFPGNDFVAVSSNEAVSDEPFLSAS